MAGTLNVTTISGASTITGVSTLNAASGVLATQNGMTGIAKAWVQFNGVTTVSIAGSFNVSSVTRNSTGLYTITYTTAMSNANYSVSGMAHFKDGNSATALRVVCLYGNAALASVVTTTSVQVTVLYTNGSPAEDSDCVMVTVLGS